jgi:ABC-type sugar transport system substrate-binding protein
MIKPILMPLVKILFIFLYTTSALAAPVKVVFLSPDPPGNAFWDNVVAFMQAAAEDLNIDLEVHIGKSTTSGTYMMKKSGLQLLNRPELPDYFITGYWPGATNQLIEDANNKGVKFFVFNTAISSEDQEVVGQPRAKYRRWIGHMYPDDVQAGYILAESLIQSAKSGDSTQVEIAGLGGNSDSAVSAKRIEGLNKYVKQSKDAKLLNIYATDWSKPATLIATDKLLSHYPSTRVIWTAADSIALYAAAGAETSGRKPGKDLLIGGVDWSDVGIQAVDAGVMVSSVGGHFMEGGWALVLIHDYHHGLDFADDLGTTILTQMQLIDQTNVKQYLRNFGDRDWGKIDFKKLSKVHNKSLKKYDFSLDQLLNQLH